MVAKIASKGASSYCIYLRSLAKGGYYAYAYNYAGSLFFQIWNCDYSTYMA